MRPRKRRIIEEQLDDAGPSPASPAPETAEELAQAAQTAPASQRPPQVRVQRIDPDDGRPKFLASIDPKLATEEYLKRRWGGGTYRLMTYGHRADGRFGYIEGTHQEIAIDPSIPFRGDTARLDAADASAAPADDDMRHLFKTQMLELVREQADARQQQMLMMTQMMKMMSDSSAANTQAIAAVVSALRPGTERTSLGEIVPLLTAVLGSRSDPVEVATRIAELTKPRADVGVDSLSGLLDLAEKLNRMRQGGDGDTSMLAVIRDVAPKALDALTEIARRSNPAPTPPTAPAPAVSGPPLFPVPSSAPAAPPASPVSDPPMDEWTPLEPQMAQLLDLARRDKDPDDVAGLVMLFAPEEHKGALRTIVAQDNVVDIVLARFPQLGPYRDWVTQFVDALYFRFYPDDEDAGDEDLGAPRANGAPTIPPEGPHA